MSAPYAFHVFLNIEGIGTDWAAVEFQRRPAGGPWFQHYTVPVTGPRQRIEFVDGYATDAVEMEYRMRPLDAAGEPIGPWSGEIADYPVPADRLPPELRPA